MQLLRSFASRVYSFAGGGEWIQWRVTLSVVAGVRTANRRRITNTWVARSGIRDIESQHIREYLCTLLRITLFFSHLLSPFTNIRYNAVAIQSNFVLNVQVSISLEGSLDWKGDRAKPGCDSRNRWKKTRWIDDGYDVARSGHSVVVYDFLRLSSDAARLSPFT